LVTIKCKDSHYLSELASFGGDGNTTHFNYGSPINGTFFHTYHILLMLEEIGIFQDRYGKYFHPYHFLAGRAAGLLPCMYFFE